MAPSYDNLPVDEDIEEDEIDFTDLQQQYEVRLEEGLDAFVVVDGLPIVPDESRQKLIKFLLRKLNSVGKAKEDGVYMPLNDKKMTEGFVFRASDVDIIIARLTLAQICFRRIWHHRTGSSSSKAATWNST